MNRIEQFKQEKPGLQILPEILRYSRGGADAISERDKALMKWYGVFFRKHTPGYFMMRVRITNGIATAAQVRTLAAVTAQLGAGFADVTTRQQLQLRSVRMADIPDVFRQLRAVGLSTLQTGMDNVRNVIGCSAAGLTPRALLDASPVARELTRSFLGKHEYANLPRKFNVAVTGCLENCVGAESQDVALVPARWGDRIGFNMLAGGKMGSGGYHRAEPLDVFVAPDAAAAVVAAAIRVFRDHGPREARSRSRFAFLLDDWGAARVRAAVEAEYGARLEPAGDDARTPTRTDHMGVYRQHDGRSFVGLVVPGGRVTATQLAELAHLADTYGSGEVRFTTEQNLLIPNVTDTALRELLAEPLLHELPYAPPEVLRGLVVCTGIDFCDLALVDTKARAIPMTRALAAKLADRKDPLRIAWSGCPASCANHQSADIGFEGTKVRIDGTVVEAVDVWVGGRGGPRPCAGQRIMENVPMTEVPSVLEHLARFFPKPRPAVGRDG